MADRKYQRIALADGAWWEVYTEVTRGMRKRVNRASMAGLPSGMAPESEDPLAIRKALLARLSDFDLNAVDDAMLLQASKAFSYGPEVTVEAIDAISDVETEKVLVVVRALFEKGSLTKEERDRFFALPSNANSPSAV